MVKNPPANAGNRRGADLIPGSGRSQEKEMATHSTLAWEFPWPEEPGRVQSLGLPKSWTEALSYM